MAVRRNVEYYFLDFYKKERNQLNKALGMMKSKEESDWSSFQNIANFHGSPKMCNYAW